MNTALLQTFITIVESGNISLAADKLFASQSTVSYRLKQLEQELGVRLLHRDKGFSEVKLTAYGEYFLVLARNYLQLINNMYSLKTITEYQMLNIDGVQSINHLLFKPFYAPIIPNRPNLYL